MEAKRRSLMAVALSSLLVLAFAAPAFASSHTQEGLVNVNVSGVEVQLPIAIAANVCDVNVNVLARQFRDGGAECTSEAESGAVIPFNSGQGAPSQEGLVNVNVSDVIVQAPIGVAANICDVNANVLAEQLRLGGAECTATGQSDAS
jgi:hypothetical protein